MIRNILKIAFRNVARNKRRNAITISAMVVGVTVILTARGLLNSVQGSLVSNVVEGMSGHLQIHKTGYARSIDAAPLDYHFAQEGSAQELIQAVPGVKAYAPRINFGGMLSNGQTTTMFMARAIDPVAETAVCAKADDTVIEGTLPTPDTRDGIALSDVLANGLGAKIGDTLTMLASTKDGAMNAYDVQVVGILRNVLPGMSNRLVIVGLAFAQELLTMDGLITEYGILLDDGDNLTAAQAALDSAIANKHPGYESSTWKDVAPLFKDVLWMQNSVFGLVTAVLFVVVLAGIVNTMMMTVFERVREIGTMMAVGIRRRTILLIFIFESLALGLFGGGIGIALGVGLVSYMGERGLEFRPPGVLKAMVIYPFTTPTYVAVAIAFALGAAVISAIYPAFRASRLRPAEALRQ